MDKKISAAIIIGSDSDLEISAECVKILKYFSIDYSLNISSAHRSADYLDSVILKSLENGAQIFIAIAGLSAALPGAIAAKTILPVIGVPVQSPHLSGFDALFSITQMPKGIPVAAMSMGKAGAQNAALLAVQILSLSNDNLKAKLISYKKSLADEIINKDLKLQIEKTGIADG